MILSKPLPPFTYDLLRFLNRDQLDRFEIVCRSLKNLIERYFQSKPCRVFDRLEIRGGFYELCNRTRYSFAKMHPYLGLPVRIKATWIVVDGESTNNPDHIANMESIAYLWRDHHLFIGKRDNSRIVAEDFQTILNSPTILQSRRLTMMNAHFSFKDYKVLNTVNVFLIPYDEDDDVDLNHCLEFIEQPGAKPVFVLFGLRREIIDNALDRLKQTFSSAVSPIAYKIAFVQVDEPMTEFRETSKTSGEVLELKKGLPVEYPEDYAGDHYTLKRSSV